MSDLAKRAADIGLSARKVAELSGLNKNTVQRVFAGQGDPLTSTVARITEAIAKVERDRFRTLSQRVLDQGAAA